MVEMQHSAEALNTSKRADILERACDSTKVAVEVPFGLTPKNGPPPL